MIELIEAADDSGARLQAHLADEKDTETLGSALAAALSPGLQIWLSKTSSNEPGAKKFGLHAWSNDST